MNLTDMLSGAAPAGVQLQQDFSYHFDTNMVPETEANRTSVHYLPTVMSRLQKDVSEAVVQIFASALLTELHTKKNRTSINWLLESELTMNNDDGVAHARMVSLMFNQLRTICMHSSLVVDHFIPKKLLLLEIKERLLHMSGKLDLFNRIVDLIGEQYERGTSPLSDDYNMLVVADSVRELERIEGLIIGKKLRYHNHSMPKLYEEERSKFIKEESVDEGEQNVEFRQRRRHFVARQSRKRKSAESELVLHLITTRQLCLSYSSSTSFDLVFAFDAAIDLTSPSVELLRSSNRANRDLMQTRQLKTPVIIPTPVYSIEHLIKAIPFPDIPLGQLNSKAESEWQSKVLNAYIVNRFRLFRESDKDFFIENYGRNLASLKQWLFQWDVTPAPSSLNHLQKYTDELILRTSDDKLEARLRENHLIALGYIFSAQTNGWDNASMCKFEESVAEPVIDYNIFKKRLAEFLNGRMEQVDTLIREGLVNIIPKSRELESQKQDEIDADETLVGEQYRKLRKLNEDATVVDRKFNRAESEHLRLKTAESEASEMLSHLKEVVLGKSEEAIGQLIEKHTSLCKQLEEEKDKLEEEHKKVVQESESLRAQYQSESSNAVQATIALQAMKDKKVSLETKLTGPGMELLPSLARKDELAIYETKLYKLQLENAFLGLLFTLRFDKLVKDRTAVLESTSLGSSSRPSNRISRASTPFS